MKKTLRKALILFAVVAMMFAVVAFSVSAEGETCAHANLYVAETVEPFCEKMGYNIMGCVDCGDTNVSTAVTKEALNHVLGERTYVANGDSYTATRYCTRENCTAVFTWEGYYKVTFVNKYAADNNSLDETVPYTDVVKDGGYITKVIAPAKSTYVEFATEDESDEVSPVRECVYENGTYVLYVKSGYTVDFRGDNPTRIKDYNYGAYKFASWKNIDEPITANTEIEAEFTGEDKSWTVTFVNYDSTSLSEKGYTVHHGNKATYDAATPVREADVKNSYTFANWTYNNQEVNLDKIYGNVTVKASFTETANKYNLAYKDVNGQSYPKTDEGVVYGGVAENGGSIAVAGYQDNQFIYVHTGKWKYVEAETVTTSLSNLVIPAYHWTYDENGNKLEYVKTQDGDSFTLQPVFNQKQRVYTINMQIVRTDFEDEDKDADNYSLEGFTIQVTNAAGQLVGNGTTDKNGALAVNLNYSTSYTVTAVSAEGKYYAEQMMAAPYQEVIDYTIRPVMDEQWAANLQPSCRCICHNSLLKPLWVRILNILYRLFNTKYVCCYDMYANIGSLLAYTQ